MKIPLPGVLISAKNDKKPRRPRRTKARQEKNKENKEKEKEKEKGREGEGREGEGEGEEEGEGEGEGEGGEGEGEGEVGRNQFKIDCRMKTNMDFSCKLSSIYFVCVFHTKYFCQ